MPDFLLEVGTEELPADFVESAIAQWQQSIPATLEENFLAADGVEFYATPRRLAVVITGLPEQQADRTEEIKGPPTKAAFKDGQLTKAGVGFAKKQGVSPDDFELRPTPKGDFIFVQKTIAGQATAEILKAAIPAWIDGLEGRRFMRWGDGEQRFPRPIRWLVALWGEAVLPLTWRNGSETLTSGRSSRGHRTLGAATVEIPQPAAYAATLKDASVWVDRCDRARESQAQIQAAAQRVGGHAEVIPELLEEVVNLVEYPNAVVGTFEAEFLSLPPEVIKMVMVAHQRYFPVLASDAPDAPLLDKFITLSNGDPAKAEVIAAGNARVIRARLADGKFFYDADCKTPLETLLPQLETVTFQADLGSVRAKVDRIGAIAQALCQQLQLPKPEQVWVERAALLCKADLVSQMVYEFPELQGIMGEKYARVGGEPEAVAVAIREHYLPRGAEDDLPQALTGQLVGIGDRLDTLVSIFGLGLIPTGSSDPFALRRAANAVVTVIWAGNLSLDLQALLAQFSEQFIQTYPERESPLAALQEFFVQRVRTLLQDDLKIDYDLINAVLGDGDPEYQTRVLTDLLDGRDRAQFLQAIRNDGQLDAIYETVNRSTRLAAKGSLETQTLTPQDLVDPGKFEQASEQAFYAALLELVPQVEQARANRDYQQLVTGLTAIAPLVSRFFDGEDSVLVMAEDTAVRTNRLNLLGVLRNQARVLADFGAIVKA
ncbi:MAG: glycine--tRNA ligase subunit beta [Cyanobacteria bacterium P01_G01_bin.54]